MPRPGQQSEGFNLMLYRNEKTGREEWLWNSRDGVTPFGISDSEDGGMMQHVDWFRDVFAPFHVPPVGSRIFVAMTEIRARIIAAEQVDRDYDRMKEHGFYEKMSREEMVDHQAKGIFNYGGGNGPDVIVVNSAMQEEFRARQPAPRPQYVGGGRHA